MSTQTPLFSKNILYGLRLLCECAENGTPADLALKKEWKRYIEPTLEWVYAQSSQHKQLPVKPIDRSPVANLRYRKVVGAVKALSGWRLHLACGHRVPRESIHFSPAIVKCEECGRRRTEANNETDSHR